MLNLITILKFVVVSSCNLADVDFNNTVNIHQVKMHFV